MSDLSYPIGRFVFPETSTLEERKLWTSQIAACPAELRAAVRNLTPEQFATPYRPGGWTISQVVHHVGDSHMNALIRFKLAMTEDTPTIKPYDEARWAELGDYATTPIEVSLNLLDNLHERWIRMLAPLSESDLQRTLRHPEQPMAIRLDQMLAWYAWHGLHHIAHISRVKERLDWAE